MPLPLPSEHAAATMDTRIEHQVVGSASIWVLGQVAGPPRSAPVLHSDQHALFADLEGFCLGVLAARAVQVPSGVRTRLPRLPMVPPGSAVVVEDGGVVIGDTEVLVTTIVDTTVPVLAPESAPRYGAHLAELAGSRLDAVRAALPSTALDRLATSDPAAVRALLGVGPGMTPVGDDVLSGWLAAGVSIRHPGLPEVRREVALSASERTTPLSTTLLGCAARGEGVPEFRSLLLGLANGRDEVIAPSLDLLLARRWSSGGGILLGAILALGSGGFAR